MKKILSLVAMALIVALCVFALASCDGAADVKIGENGNWFVGETDTGVKATGTNAEIGANGNWYLDGTDTGVKATGTNAEIGANGNWYLDGTDTGKSAIGTDAEKVTIGENGNWYIGTTDTGVKAVCGKYVVDVDSTVEFDAKFGKKYSVVTTTYSDGTTDVQKNLIPKDVQGLNFFGNTTFVAGYEPLITLYAFYTDNTDEEIIVTDDMYVGAKPNFNVAGDYRVYITYGGQLIEEVFTVVSAEGFEITNLQVDYEVAKGTPISNIGVRITLDDNNTNYDYYVSLASCTDLSDADFAKTTGEKEITFKYKGVATKYDNTVIVYDVNENAISNAYVNLYGDLIIPYQANADTVKAIVEDELIGVDYYANCYCKVYGQQSFHGYITKDMIDYSKLDTSKLGEQSVVINVKFNGIGECAIDYSVSVEADLSQANVIGNYMNNGPLDSMFGSMTLYDNNIAAFSSAGQSIYTKNENLVTVTLQGVTMILEIDTTAGTYEAYAPAGETPAVYTNADEGIYVEVYNAYVVVGMYAPAQDPNPAVYMPLFTLNKSAMVNNTINVTGSVITLNSDGTLSMEE